MPRVTSGRGSAAKSASAFHSRSRPKMCEGFPSPFGIILKCILPNHTSLKYGQLLRTRPGWGHEIAKVRGHEMAKVRGHEMARSGAQCAASRDGEVRSAASRDEAEFPGPGDGFGAVGRAELAEEMADVFLHGVEGDDELAGDG